MVYQAKTKADLQAKLDEAGDKLVVIDFFATWCGPCKRIAPFLESLAKEYEEKVVLLKVDVDEIEELVGEYNIQVMPTFVFIRKGVKLDTVTGSNEDKLSETLKGHLN